MKHFILLALCLGIGAQVARAQSVHAYVGGSSDYLSRYQAYTFSADSLGPLVIRTGHQVAVRLSVLF